MEQVIEKEIALPRLWVQLGTVHWEDVEDYNSSLSGYYLCQRLSDGHPAMKVGNFAAAEVFPRVRSVSFLPPDCSVQLYPVKTPFRMLNCIFDRDFFESTTEIAPGQWSEHIDVFATIRNRRLEAMMQQIYAELTQPGFGHGLLIEATSTMMLVEMARYGRARLGKVQEDAAEQGLAPWQLRRIRERVQASLEIGYPDLGELARLCGISESHLMRTFKASTGWQVHKYIAEERLTAAKMLLAQDALGLKEIAARLGFGSSAYFATAFRRMTGMTPTEFRRRARAPEAGNA
jgi:AraC family transcriptional regulator